MQTTVRVLGHSLHQSLVAFPVGLLATAVIVDLIALFGRYPTAIPADRALRDEPPTVSVRR